MITQADAIWALDQSTDLSDLKDIWENVWRMWKRDHNAVPPPDLIKAKDERKTAFTQADRRLTIETTFAKLASVMHHDARFKTLPRWARAVGWSSLKKWKADGFAVQFNGPRWKQIDYIASLNEPEEALIE